MSITNYSELKSSIADWLNRSDLTSVIPTFIKLGEADIARDLRHMSQEKRVTALLDEEYEVIPSDWLETINARLTDDTPLKLISQEDMASYKAANRTAGKPRYYSLTTNRIEFYPTPDGDSSMELTYFARIPSLTDATPTNWLLTNEPDVLLYASLKHAAPYLDDDERLGVWTTLYNQAIQRLQMSADASRHSGPLVMRTKAI